MLTIQNFKKIQNQWYGDWDYRGWFRAHDLTYKNFWSVVEEVVDKHIPTDLPF